MKISFSTLKYIGENVSTLHHETGGILGTKGCDVITDVFLDVNSTPLYPCSYIPNVDLLNKQIGKWNVENIEFKGLFHTHFANVYTLSDADKKYIKKIIRAMPKDVHGLYFPIFAMPENVMIPYYAYMQDDKVIIQKDKLEII